MKKIKKLSVSKETICSLNVEEQSQIKGGYTTTIGECSIFVCCCSLIVCKTTDTSYYPCASDTCSLNDTCVNTDACPDSLLDCQISKNQC